MPDAPLSVGPRLSAMAVYLPVFQHIPVERAQTLIADLAGDARSAVQPSLPARGNRPGHGRHAANSYADRGRPGGGVRRDHALLGATGEKYVHRVFTELYPAFWLGTWSLET
jgi:hypothetical protein